MHRMGEFQTKSSCESGLRIWVLWWALGEWSSKANKMQRTSQERNNKKPKDYPLSLCVLYFYFRGHHIDTLTASLNALNYVGVYLDLAGSYFPRSYWIVRLGGRIIPRLRVALRPGPRKVYTPGTSPKETHKLCTKREKDQNLQTLSRKAILSRKIQRTFPCLNIRWPRGQYPFAKLSASRTKMRAN